MTTPEASTRTEEPVRPAAEVPETQDKPASPEPSSPPATPATLSVNEDNAEEADRDETTSTEQTPPTQDGTRTTTTPPTTIPEKKGPEPKTEEVLKSSSRKRTPFTYNPDKVTLRFIFANRDGVSVTIDCEPADTVGEVKGALLSAWPKELPACNNGDRLRLICMGRGILMPDTQTLEECQVPTFKTHPTPVNVSVRPEVMSPEAEKKRNDSPRASIRNNTNTVDQGCACVIL